MSQASVYTRLRNAERLALHFAGLTGRLCAVVEWCVEHDGECLGDNPGQLWFAREVLDEVRAARDADPAS